jgi:hypothetical protein
MSRNSSKTNVYEDLGMKEKTTERKLVQAAKAVGGIALKLSCPGTAGMPDRLVLLPGGRAGFVEVKAPGAKPRPLQVARIDTLRKLGFKAFVLDSDEQIGGIIREIQTA